MNVRQSIETGLEPILREAMAAAKQLGLPARDHRQTRKAAAAEEDFLSKDCADADPLDTYRGTDQSFQRRRALYAIGYLLNPFNEGYENDSAHPLVWMNDLQEMLDLLRTALPHARRKPSDRVALAKHAKAERTREAIIRLQSELKELEASPARKAA